MSYLLHDGRHCGESEAHHVTLNDVVFDTGKLQACSVEDSVTLVHNGARRGYGLAGIGIKSGCYEWKVNEAVKM